MNATLAPILVAAFRARCVWRDVANRLAHLALLLPRLCAVPRRERPFSASVTFPAGEKGKEAK